jgi:CheY-like chemotaxis protein
MSIATRILVVDDEADVELLINQQFRRQVRAGEFSFSFAHNGEQALAMLQVFTVRLPCGGAPS